METLGHKIKSIRTAKKMTQKEFAESICISQSHLSKVEHSIEGLSKATKKLLWILYSIDEKYLKE